MGTGSCSSSNCHGSVAPVAASTVLQNEYVTWQKHDKHSQAFKVLGNDDSARIVKHLGLRDAQREPLCLQCHSTYVPEVERRGDKFQLEDGVSCEGCHGAAENWLSSHTSRGTKHEDNIGKGLVELAGVKRAELCLSCHMGNDEKTVDHRLIGAGHPRLSFESDTFESIMPRHWNIDDDYKKRKGVYNSADAWIHGQVLLARAQVDKMLSKKRSTNGLFPEFTMFSCYSCHHSLVEDQWKKREYGDHVGEPQLNLSSLVVLREALGATNPKAASAISASLANLHKDFRAGKAEQSLRALDKTLADPSLSASLGANRRAVLKRIAAYGANTPSLPYETAEQVAMALSSLTADDSRESEAVAKDMEALYQSLKSEEEFAPEQFTAAAQRLAQRSGW